MDRPFEPSGVPDTQSDPEAAAHVALAVNGMGTFSWDVDAGLISYDDGGLAVMGFRPGEFDGRLATLGERIVPSEVPAIEDLVDRALRERSGFSLYFRVRHPDGRLQWTHTQGHIVRDEHSRPVRVIGIIRDASQELRAVDQTELLRQAREERHRPSDVVVHVSDALVPTVTVEDVAEALTDSRLMERIGVSSVILGLIDNGRMELVGSNGVHEGLIQDFHLSRLSEPLPLTEAARTREAVFVTNRLDFIARFPALTPYMSKFPDAAAAVYLPLIAQDTPIGAVGLTYEGRASFPPEERTVLTALGKVIAQSLQRALLYDQEHELAAGLQTAMLPGILPHVPGVHLATRYRPTRARGGIGGDWYDALTLPDGRIAVVVGDVQGHDVTAAAVMGQLRIALRAYAAEGHPPSTAMARASAFLAELDTDRFATCLMALVDPLTGMTSVVRAGHPEPVLRSPDGSCAWLDTPVASPSGSTRRVASPRTRSSRPSSNPARLWCCARTGSSSRAPRTSTRGVSGSSTRWAPGRGRPRPSPTICWTRWPPTPARRTTWLSWCCNGPGGRRLRHRVWRRSSPRRSRRPAQRADRVARGAAQLVAGGPR